MKKKKRPPLPETQNLKAALSANFSFDAAPGDLHPAEAVLSWLNGRAAHSRPREDIQRHLEALKARVAGESATKLALERGIDPKLLTAPPIWVREFGFCTFELDGIVVSVDVFNAADELRLGDQARNVVELFRVDGRDVTPLVNAAAELMDATDTTLVFGGIMFYVDTFMGFRAEGPASRRAAFGVSDLLWPLMGLRKDYPEDTLATLPVHRVLRVRRGTVIQTFEDLWSGGSKEYDEAAHRLGLTSFWEVQRFRKK